MENTLNTLGIEVGKALSPLVVAIKTTQGTKELIAQLGWQLPPGTEDIGLSTIPIDLLIEKLRIILNSSSEDQSDELLMATQIGELIVAISRVIEGIVQVANNLPTTLSSVADFVNRSRIDQELVPRLLDYLISNYIVQRSPMMFAFLRLSSILELKYFELDPIIFQTKHTRSIIHYDRLPNLIGNPGLLFQEGYGWGTADFEVVELLNNFSLLLQMLGSSVYMRFMSRKVEEALLGRSIPEADAEPAVIAEINLLKEAGVDSGTEVSLAAYYARPPNVGGNDGGVGFMPVVRGTTDFVFPLSENLSLELDASFDFSGGINLILRPEQPPVVESGMFSGAITIPATGRLLTGLRYSATEGEPTTLLSFPGGTRLEIQQFQLQGGVEQQPSGSFDPIGELSVRGLRFLLSLSSSDSFLQEGVGTSELAASFDMTIGWSPQGIYFQGSAALEIMLPVHIGLGPVEIQTIYLILSVGETDNINLEVSSGLSLKLGPLAASVERLGVKATLDFTDTTGNLGPLDLALDFKPPNGVGLAVDAGVIKGGGYLYFDFEREEYAGALELVFSGFLTLKAIGLITTKMPDGSKGFSLLVIITAEFGTGLQLGYGFTLLGVGGLIGLNRTMKLQPLVDGVRTGTISNILFPRDVVANAPRIISDLRTIFPPEEGKFLIGPMAKLGWGTPTLVSLSLGIIIEIPGNIAILGVLRVALPTDDAALLILQVSFIGAIEFDKKRVYFFATLFESRILFITLEGEMGLLVAYGDDANFVVSVGGFHPRFNPPPLPFPNPARICLSILNESYARIRVMGYFAVTSNSAQFGARAELFFGFDAISVEGLIAFDALFQFSPFYFIIEITAAVALKVFGAGVLSIRLQLSLEGPTPWRAKGSGSISFLFFEISANFDVTWGESSDTALPPIEVMPILKAELEKLENWRALLTPGNNLLVSLRNLEPTEELILHPVGTLQITQKAIPLDLSIDKVGSQKPTDANRLSVRLQGTGLSEKAKVKEQFAIAQFQNMDDASKLSRRAYDPLIGGLEISTQGQQLRSSQLVRRIIRYEKIIIDTNYQRAEEPFFLFFGALFSHFLKGNSISKSALSNAYKTQLQPFTKKIKVRSENYAVALQSTNQMVTAEATFASEAMAMEFMQRQIARNSNLHDTLHVIPQYEVMP